MYIENPKTAGSGILCAIPQTGRCPNGCNDCFFQSGRSYLEPLAEHLPNMPSAGQAEGFVVRVNDGNDSHHRQEEVMDACAYYRDKFYNTSCPDDLDLYDGPVVLTTNPGDRTDKHATLRCSKNLMAVRVRTNTWNLRIVQDAVNFYTPHTAVFLTFMAYHDLDDIPQSHRRNYTYRKRTLNEYWAIMPFAWREVMEEFADYPWVYSCGEGGRSGCRQCGNCLREYFAWKVKQ